jgi:23S rRNA (guanosine2251-2'-O)-methyltransferase
VASYPRDVKVSNVKFLKKHDGRGPARRDDRRPARDDDKRPNSREQAPVDYKAQKAAQSALLEDWIWGEHSVEICAESKPENLLEIFVENAAVPKLKKVLEKVEGLKVSYVEKLPRFLSEKRTQGVAAKIKKFPVFYESDFYDKHLKENEKSQVLILDRIQDPQNFGAILRSAAGLGATSVFIGRREQCPVNGTVALVSAGNLFKLNIFIANNLAKTCEKLKEHGFWIGALESGAKDLSTLLKDLRPKKIAWVLGAEEDGIHSSVLKSVDEKVGIPMQGGVESLNVSNSAAIALYEGYSALKA